MKKGQKYFVYQRKSDGKCFIGRQHTIIDSLIVVRDYRDYMACAGMSTREKDNYNRIGRLTIKTVYSSILV